MKLFRPTSTAVRLIVSRQTDRHYTSALLTANRQVKRDFDQRRLYWFGFIAVGSAPAADNVTQVTAIGWNDIGNTPL